MRANLKRWPWIVWSGWRAFVYLLAWELVAPLLVWKSEFHPDLILYNAPESQWWIVAVVIGIVAFILYGASQELGKSELENVKLREANSTLRDELDSQRNVATPKPQVVVGNSGVTAQLG